MADRINFDKKINDSVQVGDELYWGTVSGTTVSAANLVGTIINVGKKYVEVNNGNAPTPFVSDTMFFMFRKPIHTDASLPNGGYTNTSSLKGYYAEVQFTNSSTNPQELFAVGSEVTMSSK